MINLTKMLTEFNSYGDKLRYHKSCSKSSTGTLKNRGPVVVWNCTGKCNLKCKHCYSNSASPEKEGVLTTKEGLNLIDDLTSNNIPVLLFSGGEPFKRKDLFTLIDYATQSGIRSVISSNGTLIDKQTALKAKKHGVSYIGISLDGMRDINDQFRGVEGAFDMALRGIRNCQEVDQKVGLRFTINKFNYQEIDNIFRLIEQENIPRVCFYHLVYSGRGEVLKDYGLDDQTKREVMDKIINWTRYFIKQGNPKEILTVDNHADGVYLYLKMIKNESKRADKIYQLLQLSGGNRSGIAIANIDHKGEVHPDQFTSDINLGNIRDSNFSEIWKNNDSPFLQKLRERKKHLKGRCRECRFLDLCNGNFRARAHSVTGDFWASDPGCYLTDEEIGVDNK